MKTAIRQRARELGFDLCRFTTAAAPTSADRLRQWLAASRHGEMTYLERNAAKRMDPQLVCAGARTVICLAASYFTAEAATPIAGQRCLGVIARYARFADYHDVLSHRLAALARFVNDLHGDSVRSLWYVDTGPVLERDFAQRAGIGFVGKHTNVLSRGLGNWILLAEILTTAEIAPDQPEVNRCGTCVRCLEACPTRAITGPFQLDARRCISYLTIELRGPIPLALRPLIGNRVFGCDDCLAACPWNRFAKQGQMMREHYRPEFEVVDLLGLLALDEESFKRRFHGTPIFRAKRRGLLRNACVALGNVGGEQALPALGKACHDPDPLIAEHASWALAQIRARSRLRGP